MLLSLSLHSVPPHETSLLKLGVKIKAPPKTVCVCVYWKLSEYWFKYSSSVYLSMFSAALLKGDNGFTHSFIKLNFTCVCRSAVHCGSVCVCVCAGMQLLVSPELLIHFSVFGRLQCIWRYKTVQAETTTTTRRRRQSEEKNFYELNSRAFKRLDIGWVDVCASEEQCEKVDNRQFYNTKWSELGRRCGVWMANGGVCMVMLMTEMGFEFRWRSQNSCADYIVCVCVPTSPSVQHSHSSCVLCNIEINSLFFCHILAR